jgi:integrase
VRSGETRGAIWDEIDLVEKVWTVPANPMKAGKAHKVPLSSEAIVIINAIMKAKSASNSG